ncbi:MAG: bcp [Chlamydiales bacterium]|jgi:peroxiredoxin Q/BCP|nr:bcp [Chlamydiales bacterium]
MDIHDTVPFFEILDMDGSTVTQKDLIAHYTVLYFYPKDNTPGCTKQACSFRDHLEKLKAYNVQVWGVSSDSAQSHKKFMEKHKLTFRLLCDPRKELAQLFGLFKEQSLLNKILKGVPRTTFIIDPEGKVVWKEKKVSVAGHTERILEFLQQLKK